MTDEQNIWNAALTLLFVLCIALSYLSLVQSGVPHAIPTFDALLLALATFRLTRLFVYDHITQWIRDLFLQVRVTNGSIVREKPERGVRRTIATLLDCPWCLGMWAAYVLTYLYFLTPHTWFFVLVLAIAGLGTLLQLLANLVGRSAEYKKMQLTTPRQVSERPMTCYDCGSGV
jgi:hypothetical protein